MAEPSVHLESSTRRRSTCKSLAVYRYVKAGVLCLNLVADEERQGSLFKKSDPAEDSKQRRLMAAVDALNGRYGRGTVRTATAGFQQGWQMRHEKLSASYTTRLADVPSARL